MALDNATESAATSTVLKVAQVEPSRGFAAWQALVDGCAPKSSNDPTIVPQPTLATPKKCKDAKELKEKHGQAEYEHQFKVIDDAQKTFMAREMMPTDIKREFLTGSRKLDVTVEKVGDHHQRYDVRRRTSTNGCGECRYARCEDDTE